MPFAIINNIRMHFEVGDKGDPVLLINGLSAPAANWARPTCPASQCIRPASWRTTRPRSSST